MIRLYFPLDALHVSDSLVHHQEQLYKLYIAIHLHAIKPQYYVTAYTNCDIQLQNIAADDGLKSPKHVEYLMINKDTL